MIFVYRDIHTRSRGLALRDRRDALPWYSLAPFKTCHKNLVARVVCRARTTRFLPWDRLPNCSGPLFQPCGTRSLYPTCFP